MKRSRNILSVAIATAMLLGSMAACGDAPTASRAVAAGPTSSTLLGGLSPLPIVGSAAGLTRLTSLLLPVKTGAWMDSRGGQLALPSAGLTVSVPSGAIPVGAGRIYVSVTALAGSVTAYEFGPHGTTFAKPIVLTQSLKGTNWQSSKSTLELGYMESVKQLNQLTGVASINEYLPVKLDEAQAKVTATTTHFSGYMVTSGRKSNYEEQ